MKRFELQGVELPTSATKAFAYIADAANLPVWTNAFAEVTGDQAVMKTPEGEVSVSLRVEAAAEQGTIDWFMTFPDGAVATAFSRIVDLGEDRCAYSFVLTPPPAPLEAIEGILEEQAGILRNELAELGRILSA